MLNHSSLHDASADSLAFLDTPRTGTQRDRQCVVLQHSAQVSAQPAWLIGDDSTVCAKMTVCTTGAGYISQGLREHTNERLMDLDLGYNEIKDEGACAVAQV